MKQRRIVRPIVSPAKNRERKKIARLVPALLDWFGHNARDLPWRRTRDPYAIWVSEVMLQQTQVKTVLPYWERWMRELPTIQAVAGATSAKIHKLWEGLGYYTRARNLQKAARLVVEKHDGRFPWRHEDILALPGVGRYTAGAVSSIAFNQPAPVLDGNVIRVLTRIFGINTNPREPSTNARLWTLAETLVQNAKDGSRGEKSACSQLNQSLMELGAVVCTPRRPRCEACPVSSECAALRQDCVEELPNLTGRSASTLRQFAAFVVRRGDRFLVRQRPEDGVNARLWEFPNAEMESGSSLRMTARSALGFAPTTIERLGVIKHSITRYRITLNAYIVKGGGNRRASQTEGRWLKLSELDRLSLPSAHRKILSALSAASR